MINTGAIMNTTIDDLHERVRIVRSVTARDEAGDIVVEAEETRAEVWAKVLPLSSRISVGEVEQSNEVIYRVVIRCRDDIDPTDTIEWRGKRLAIAASPYDAEGRRIWTVIDCRELIESG